MRNVITTLLVIAIVLTLVCALFVEVLEALTFITASLRRP